MLRKIDVKAIGRIVWLALLGTMLFFCLYPVNIGLLRLFFVLAIPALFIGASVLLMLWNRKRLALVPLLCLGLVAAFLLLPGRDRNAAKLRERYVSALLPYEGARYIWGGENRFGIDCSGLVRKGLINAHAWEALFTLNPSHAREALTLWWHDCSAQALKQEYRNWTRHLFDADSVNGIDLARLAPGDLAVTADGAHIMVYLGRGEWIEADPGLGRVLRAHVPVKSGWFEMPVSIMRWRLLEDRRAGKSFGQG